MNKANQYTLSADAPQTPMAKLATYGASLISNPLETASLVVRGEPIRKVRYSGDNPLEKLFNLGDAVTVSEQRTHRKKPRRRREKDRNLRNSRTHYF